MANRTSGGPPQSGPHDTSKPRGLCYNRSMKSGLRFLTLNCWGLPFLTPQKNRRLDAITETIRNGKWDVVALQEVWMKSDQERIIKNSGFPYHVSFSRRFRLFGAGLIVLSRYPIIESDFHTFAVKGFPHRLTEGDFHASKGVGYVLIDSPAGKIPVFVTHLIAKYSRRNEIDINRVFRIAQILELVFYIRRKATPGSFILCGDLNSTRDDLEMQALQALTGTPPGFNPRLKSNRLRLDHILCGATHSDLNLKVSAGSLVFRNRFGVERLPFSDHEGVSAIIKPWSGKAEPGNIKRVLQRTFRYMNYSLKSVRELDAWLRCLPLLGLISHSFMKPQFMYLEALMNMLETDLKLAKSEHPLRLKEIV
jgi:endonuclease/exonuclease/phosphatase family metal-dependent hydrolase